MPFVRRFLTKKTNAAAKKTALQSSIIALDNEDWTAAEMSTRTTTTTTTMTATTPTTAPRPQQQQRLPYQQQATPRTHLPDVYLQPRRSDQGRTRLVQLLSVAELQAGRVACVAAISILAHELVTGGESMLLAMLQR